MMDIRRRPTPQPPSSGTEAQSGTQRNLPFKEKEELYITQKDIADVLEVEKKYQRGLRLKLFLKFLAFIFFLILLCTGSFFAWKTYAVSKKMGADSSRQTSFPSDMKSVLSTLIPNKNHQVLKGENEGRINILLLGAAGEKNPGKNLTDTLMLLSIDTKNKKVALLSLPRDLYVKVPNEDFYTKINGLYQYGLSSGKGVSQIREVVETITGTPIQYYLVANFEGFEKLIDDIGGINVTVERDIYDPAYPGPNYSYQTFELKKGFHKLDGATALKYVRERHDDPEGDFGRAKRQQQVIQAVKNKIFSAHTLFNIVALNNILTTLGNNIKTDIALDEMESFLSLVKQVDTQNINNVVVDAWQKESLLKVSHVQIGPTRMFILVPRVGNYSEIKDVSSNIFDRGALEKRRAQIENEEATITIINESGDGATAAKLRKLLTEKLNFKNVRIEESKSKQTRNATSVIDNTNNKKIYSLDELLKKIPSLLSLETDPTQLEMRRDFIILLGEDAIETYKYEEDSFEEYNNSQYDNNFQF